MGFDLLKGFYVSLSNFQIDKQLNGQPIIIPTKNGKNQK